MHEPSREPWDLAGWMSRRLQRANVAHRAQADALLVWAAWNLDSAQLGWDLLQRARPNGDQNLTGHPMRTVEMAALNLVFRGVVSAMDQCAAAVFRLTGEPYRADREHTVGWWFKKGQKQPWPLVPTPLERWLRQFDGNRTWELRSELRHALTHRTVPRHVTIVVGGKSFVQLELSGARHETEDAMLRMLTFGRQRYSAFERALASSYPMRQGWGATRMGPS
jgi:hypothetical protein